MTEDPLKFLKKASVAQLQNATLHLKKHIMKKTLLALPTSTSLSGGATVDINLEDLLCPLTQMICKALLQNTSPFCP